MLRIFNFYKLDCIRNNREERDAKEGCGDRVIEFWWKEKRNKGVTIGLVFR
jgi:hypothetical protein